MYINYRDDLGYVTVAIESPVLFLDGKAYFTTSDGIDMIVETKNIDYIG